MTKRMLIDASHPEETRVVVLDGNRVEEFDLETANRKPLKGNIYLAKVVRVEPSLQAAFVEYGGNRHGFLAFGEIHPDYYQIPVADRQRLLEMQAEEARAEEEADLPPESAMDRAAAWNGEGPEGWAAGEPAPNGEEQPAAAAPEGEAGAPEPLPADAAPEAAAAAPGEAPAEEAASAPPPAMAEDAAPAEHAAGDEPAAPAARALDIAPERVVAAEQAAGEGAAPEAEETGRVETIATEDLPPPETIGGEDQPAEAEEERRERRIPPKFLRHYKIQEVIRRRQIMLVQVVKEERGGKGAALTTYISLAGRFSVLMPNSPRGGGVSRKITSAADRKRLREVVEEMNLPEGMSLIVRTAGAQRPKPEIKRDCEYLLRLWDNIRERTLASTAPALIYEEADLIKRSIRDVFGRDIEEVIVEGEDAYSQAREFMRMLMPANAGKIRLHRDSVPLFARHNVDAQLDAMHSPVVQLRSGGYIVINQTEALVAIDVNSGRATRDRHIEDTALRTNLEAADEIARQLRLRDLAGLIVIDFIDMESSKHDAMVEKRLKEALKQDRARIQVGRISHFGLLEMSRQRLRPSIAEQTFVQCPHCQGRGLVRSVESSALQVLRAIEEEGAKRRAAEIMVRVAAPVALWLLNRKRERLAEIEARFGMAVMFEPDDTLMPPALRIERLRAAEPAAAPAAAPALRMDYAPEPEEEAEEAEEAASAERPAAERAETEEEGERRRRRRRRRRGRREEGAAGAPAATAAEDAEGEELPAEGGEPAEAEAPETVAADGEESPAEAPAEGEDSAEAPRRRRGRRGGRRRREDGPAPETPAAAEAPEEAPAPARRPRYAGPTPADPFAGQIDDIFEVLEAAEAAAERAAASRPARAASPEPAAAPAEPPAARPEPAAAPEPSAPAAAHAAPAEEPAAAPAPAAPVEEPAAAQPPPAAEAPPPAPAAPAEPVVGQPVLPVVLGSGAEAERPKRQGWWRR
ncbi:ribonuclease E [Roseomonas alkaliterrae]|uniref:Ribonuclease E n=2 Tax=Neoroseomonas alkaliterrae TaxID=1452450 RepID=A0A840XU01_9PROT|nr:ribonuclease E/G [Neoroseomonas alkaliterrae]MBB5690490.1 ribonuclease E [Neoroseomonas alkaliterrae]